MRHTTTIDGDADVSYAIQDFGARMCVCVYVCVCVCYTLLCVLCAASRAQLKLISGAIFCARRFIRRQTGISVSVSASIRGIIMCVIMIIIVCYLEVRRQGVRAGRCTDRT